VEEGDLAMASLAEKRIVDVEERSVDPEARPEELRLLEALLFASTEPLDQATLAKRMPDGVDIKMALAQLQADYAPRGVALVAINSNEEVGHPTDSFDHMVERARDKGGLDHEVIAMLERLPKDEYETIETLTAAIREMYIADGYDASALPL